MLEEFVGDSEVRHWYMAQGKNGFRCVILDSSKTHEVSHESLEIAIALCLLRVRGKEVEFEESDND
jgi:hypothetical protein